MTTFPWRRVLLTWPARAISGYFLAIRAFYGLVVLVIWPILLLALVLYFGFGIRWGW